MPSQVVGVNIPNPRANSLTPAPQRTSALLSQGWFLGDGDVWQLQTFKTWLQTLAASDVRRASCRQFLALGDAGASASSVSTSGDSDVSSLGHAEKHSSKVSVQLCGKAQD